MEEHFPEPVRRHLVDFSTTGENLRTSSNAQVFHYERGDGAGVFLKIEADEKAVGLGAEHRRLVWLQGKLPVPKVLGYWRQGEVEYLLTEALPGVGAHKPENRQDPAGMALLVAQALKQIHALPMADCPFDRRYPILLERAERIVQRGWADSGEEDPQGRLGIAVDRAPTSEDLVFTHGDYCLPNILVAQGGFTGLVDWGYAGVGDRYIDLEACASSVRRNLGPAWVPVFFAHYGLEAVDTEKLERYRVVRLSD